MIAEALQFLTFELNAHLAQQLGRSSEAYAIASALSNPDGSAAQGIDQRVILTVINVERETGAGMLGPRAVRSREGGLVQSPAPVSLNLTLLMAANHSRYLEALKRLSAAIGFVQAHPVLDASSSGETPLRVDRLTLELVNLDLHALSNLWSSLGAKYMPSVVLRMRLLTVDEERVDRRVPEVQGVQRDVQPGKA